MENGSRILEGLNSEQKAAVSCVDGPVLIVAGAGSGKNPVAYIYKEGSFGDEGTNCGYGG